MIMHATGSFTGNYIPQGSVAEADCVIAHEFAVREDGFGSVNEALAHFVLQNYTAIGLDLLLGENIAGALEQQGPHVPIAAKLTGQVSTFTNENTGTWGELEQAFDYMQAKDLHCPILVAQAFHIGRVSLQAMKMSEERRYKVEPIVPAGLPKAFDKQSSQIWTRNRFLWALREFPGAYVLQGRGHL